MSDSKFWRERRGSEREDEEERMESTVKEGRFQKGEVEQAKKASLGEVEARADEWTQKLSRTICRVLVSLPSLAKHEMKKEIGRRRVRS